MSSELISQSRLQSSNWLCAGSWDGTRASTGWQEIMENKVLYVDQTHLICTGCYILMIFCWLKQQHLSVGRLIQFLHMFYCIAVCHKSHHAAVISRKCQCATLIKVEARMYLCSAALTTCITRVNPALAEMKCAVMFIRIKVRVSNYF